MDEREDLEYELNRLREDREEAKADEDDAASRVSLLDEQIAELEAQIEDLEG